MDGSTRQSHCELIPLGENFNFINCFVMSPPLQVVDQRKLEKVDAKLKSKLEKKALKDMEEMASATKRYTVASR